MLDIVHRVAYYGHKVLRYRNFIGAVVHIYNVLRSSEVFSNPIPILEALCEDMASFFFAGGTRPEKNLFKGYVRFLGGRLRFKKGHRGNDHRASWCMAIPGHAAKRSSGLGDGWSKDQKGSADNSCRETCDSFLVQLVNNDYNAEMDANDRRIRRSSEKHARTSSMKGLRSQPATLSTMLESVFEDLTEELKPLTSPTSSSSPNESTRPQIHPTTLDYFTLYASALRTVETICSSDPELVASHDPPSGAPCRCLCWVEQVFADAETFRHAARDAAKGQRQRRRSSAVHEGQPGSPGNDWPEQKTNLLNVVARTIEAEFAPGGGSSGLGKWTWSLTA